MIHKENKVLKIIDLYRVRSLPLTHKAFHHPDKSNIAYQGFTRSSHSRALRNNLNFQISAHSYTNSCKITERSSTIWNEISNVIKLNRDRDLFKHNLYILYLSIYNY